MYASALPRESRSSEICVKIKENLKKEWRKHLLACVHIVGKHFEQFYCRQLKNGQLNKMSAIVSEV